MNQIDKIQEHSIFLATHYLKKKEYEREERKMKWEKLGIAFYVCFLLVVSLWMLFRGKP